MTAVKRYEYGQGWREVASRPPHPALASHVGRYWGFVESSPMHLLSNDVVPFEDVWGDGAQEPLKQDAEPHLERIALACGYYDQPHFNRDFRAFAESTPTEFLARLFPSAPGLAPD